MSGVSIAVLAAALIAGARNQKRVATSAPAKRIVVAVFQNQTGDSTLNNLQMLAADWITREIAAIPGVDILYPGVLYLQGRTPSGTPTAPIELAKNNGAQIAVAGSFYRSNDSLFFNATLIDVNTGRVVRTLGPFPADESNPLDAIDDLRQGASVALASMLDRRVSEFVSPTARMPRMDAYREFLIGEELHWRGDMRNALTHFARAGQLDSSFLFVPARMAITAVRANRCDLVDSIAAAQNTKSVNSSDTQRPWVLVAVAQCDGNMDEVIAQQRLLLERNPSAPLTKWALAAATRRANRPAEALQVLKTFNPEQDLGWMGAQRTLFFWREMVGAQHAVEDFDGEWKSADQFGHTAGAKVMSYYYKGRSFAGRHDLRPALMMVDSIELLPAEPVVQGEAAIRLRPIRAATTGWALYAMSEELLAHGYPAEARAVAKRTIEWVNGRTELEKNDPEYRLMLAQAMMMDRQYSNALNLLTDLVKVDSGNVTYRAALGRAAALSGDTATARRVASSLVTKQTQRGAGPRFLGRAEIALALGDRRGALALLDSLPFHLHPTDFLLLHSSAALAPLHNEPRFRSFIKPKG